MTPPRMPDLTPQAAHARLAAVDPAAYAASRNHLDGAVTGLSPWITHGQLTLAEVVETLRARHHLPLTHKLVQELAWRASFRHTWRQLGDAIFDSRHPGPLPDGAYAPALPPDLRAGATGVPAIDQAVRMLYATGLLHNHARLWLAAYTVHVRKVHWRAGADWLYGHLLDGDLASNHLSWQWVAGTASARPYLASAANIALFAPPAWHSPGTVLDQPPDALLALAARPQDAGPEPGDHPGVGEPTLTAEPPPAVRGLFHTPDPAAVAGQDLWLVHPWSLADPPPGTQPVAVLDSSWHHRWPWSPARWDFVLTRMTALAPVRWCAPAEALAAALSAARRVRGRANPHLAPALARWCTEPDLPPWPEPAAACRSFSAYWSRVLKASRPAASEGVGDLLPKK